MSQIQEAERQLTDPTLFGHVQEGIKNITGKTIPKDVVSNLGFRRLFWNFTQMPDGTQVFKGTASYGTTDIVLGIVRLTYRPDPDVVGFVVPIINEVQLGGVGKDSMYVSRAEGMVFDARTGLLKELHLSVRPSEVSEGSNGVIPLPTDLITPAMMKSTGLYERTHQKALIGKVTNRDLIINAYEDRFTYDVFGWFNPRYRIRRQLEDNSRKDEWHASFPRCLAA